MKNSSSKVSIIIPTYERGSVLRDAVESALAQTFENTEIIVVDDSPENTAEKIVREYKSVEYLSPDGNRGPNLARTYGFSHSTGDYIQFLDDDDILYQKKIEKQVGVMKTEADIGVVYSGVQSPDGENSYPVTENRGNVLKEALKTNLHCCVTSAMLIDREILARIMPLPDIYGCDDTYFKIELADLTSFEFINEPLVIKRDTNDSVGDSLDASIGTQNLPTYYDTLYDKFPPAVSQSVKASGLMREMEYHLMDRMWSYKAIVRAGQAVYANPGFDFVYMLRFFATFFGKPGMVALEYALNKV